MPDQPVVHFDGKEYPIDSFELGELEFVEEYVGSSLADESAMSSMRAAIAFVTVIKRREDSSFGIEDARKMNLAAIDAAASRPTKPAARKKAA